MIRSPVVSVALVSYPLNGWAYYKIVVTGDGGITETFTCACVGLVAAASLPSFDPCTRHDVLIKRLDLIALP